MQTTDVQFIGVRYRLDGIIGTGGMGTVYRATDRLTGRPVALKRVKASLDDLRFSSKGGGNNDLALVKEFRTLSSLRHPYIIDVLDYGFDSQKNPFFTMELLESSTPILDYAALANLDTVFDRVLEILQVLVYMHRRGILHRDIKPSNLMVVNNHIKILDFGLAKSVQARSSDYNKDTIAGTMAYMAPELFRGEDISHASDLYAVGLVIYEMLAGVYPFQGKNLAYLAYEIMNTPPDLMRLNIINDDVIDIIDRLLVKDPEERYQDAAEALEDLRQALNRPDESEPLAIRESFLHAATFVGRDNELEILRTAMNEVAAGKGSAWLIGGESGVGKTRLLDELRIRALVSGVRVLRGQVTAERQQTYNTWREILPPLCLEVELTDLEAQVLKALVPDIDRLIDRDVADASSIQPQTAHERLLQVTESVFRK